MTNIKENFEVSELVCDHVFSKHGESSWRFLDPRLLKTLAYIRWRLNKPIWVNFRGHSTQRGLRCNLCELTKNRTTAGVLYISAHVLGCAVDFDVEGMLAEEVRQWIENNKRQLPYPVRLEQDVRWVHMDVATVSEEKVTYFKGH